MDISDLTKEVRRALLSHWTEKEINERLSDPEYFIDHVVNPYFNSIRKKGKDAPCIRIRKNTDGQRRLILS